MQGLARLFYCHAYLTAAAIGGSMSKKKPEPVELYDAFPGVWSDEEINAAKVEKYKQRMLKMVARHNKK